MDIDMVVIVMWVVVVMLAIALIVLYVRNALAVLRRPDSRLHSKLSHAAERSATNRYTEMPGGPGGPA